MPDVFEIQRITYKVITKGSIVIIKRESRRDNDVIWGKIGVTDKGGFVGVDFEEIKRVGTCSWR